MVRSERPPVFFPHPGEQRLEETHLFLTPQASAAFPKHLDQDRCPGGDHGDGIEQTFPAALGGERTRTTAGAIRGESTPRPASRPSCVFRPPSWRQVTPLLSRGEASASRLAVGRAGGVGTGDQFSRARAVSPRWRTAAGPAVARSRARQGRVMTKQQATPSSMRLRAG